jgi:hypothetical protein
MDVDSTNLLTMSSSVLASFSKPSNKGFNNLAQQGYDDLNNDFFDQFLTFDTADNDHESPDYSILPDTFDDGPIDGGLSGSSSSHFQYDNAKRLDSQEGTQGEETLLHDAASFDSVLGSCFYTEVTGRAAVSDSELLSLEKITLDSSRIDTYPQSSPSSPFENAGPYLLRKNRIAEFPTRTLRRTTGSVDKSRFGNSIKKATSSRMLRAHYSNHSQEFWESNTSYDSAKLDLLLDGNTLPPSPPSSTSVFSASESSLNSTKRGNLLNRSNCQINTPQQTIPSMEYHTPLSTPGLEQHQTPRTNYIATSSSPFPISPKNHSTSGSWCQVPHSTPPSSIQPCGNGVDSTSHLFSEIDGPLWWNHASTAPMVHSSPSGYQGEPQPTEKPLVAMQCQRDLQFNATELAFDSLDMSNGLMIQMASESLHTPYLVDATGGSPSQHQGYFASQQSLSQPHHHHQAAERQQNIARTRQRLPHPLSHPPPHSSPPRHRIHHRSHSSYHPPRYETHRQTPGSDSEDSPSPSPTPQVRKRKSASNNRSKVKNTSTTPGTVDFVNFTPSDSRRILTGVAPSGSSKTKARRENEALEKRRKLSQAAVRAVRAAGGDVKSLMEQGLLF